jgi:hypothetical protein
MTTSWLCWASPVSVGESWHFLFLISFQWFGLGPLGFACCFLLILALQIKSLINSDVPLMVA